MSNKYDPILGEYRQADFSNAIGDARYLLLDQTTPQTTVGTFTFPIVQATTLKILEGGASPTKYSIFQGGNQAVDLTYTLPTAYPTVSNCPILSSGGGVLSWNDQGIKKTSIVQFIRLGINVDVLSSQDRVSILGETSDSKLLNLAYNGEYTGQYALGLDCKFTSTRAVVDLFNRTSGMNFELTEKSGVNNSSGKDVKAFTSGMDFVILLINGVFTGSSTIGRIVYGTSSSIYGGTVAAGNIPTYTGTSTLTDLIYASYVSLSPSLKVNNASATFVGSVVGSELFVETTNYVNTLSASFTLAAYGNRITVTGTMSANAYGLYASVSGATNNYGAYLSGATAALQAAGHIIFTTDNTYNLGNSTYWLKDFYQKGKHYFGATTEYFWSANAGYVDVNANTGIRLNKDTAVTGDMKATTYHVGTDAGIDATVTYVDTLLGAKTLTFKKGILTNQV